MHSFYKTIHDEIFFGFRLLMNSEELRLFDKVRVFLDEDFSSAEHFTVSNHKFLFIRALNWVSAKFIITVTYLLLLLFSFFFLSLRFRRACNYNPIQLN